jgi:hypothetical protein
MSIWEHSRFAIYNANQHPYRHSTDELAFSSTLLPSTVTNLREALDYIIAVLYPNYVGTFATPAALPVGAANDYAVVTDDGDGKSAGYVFQILDGAGVWIKRYDVDWSLEGIFAETVNRTQYMYVHKYGFTDHDAAGVAIVGTYAGQTQYGGNLTGQNLTLNANSADATGYVQTDNSFRPTANGTLDLGTTLLRFANGYINTLLAGTMTVTSGSITDSSGAISFGDENLTTTGNVQANTATVSTSVTVNTAGNALVLSTGSITSATGAISFGDENLSTTGTLASGTITVSADMVIATGSITSASGAITFGNENLTTTGTLGAGDTTVTRLDSDNIRIDGNTISVTNVGGNMILVANGVGVVDVQSAMTTLSQTVTGTVGITGQLNIDNLRLDGNVISSTNLNGNITLTPNGAGFIETSAKVLPAADGTLDLAATLFRFKDLFLSGVIGDGTTSITQATLQSLRDINVGVGVGFTIFWDGLKWVASAPDTEIDHGTITGLLDDDHTQYLLLAGRAGGQSANGGVAASENLTLDSTSHATKGSIFVKSNVSPFTDASYTPPWAGTDLGDGTHYFRDVYTKGEHFGFRFDNGFTSATLPAAGASTQGRALWTTDDKQIYVDDATAYQRVTVRRHIEDTVWNGTDLTKTITVSANITDARKALWQLRDNSNSYEIMFVPMTTSLTQVTITVSVALPAGSYRLIGIE